MVSSNADPCRELRSDLFILNTLHSMGPYDKFNLLHIVALQRGKPGAIRQDDLMCIEIHSQMVT